ncbi:hypothetical protein B484DRAFT_427211 [Ochromonadaceae sp. CCMP2298]|nr:hypothetical protein B484DRAFT_427211 [Ochromonadaceae sp. CCMP2298]
MPPSLRELLRSIETSPDVDAVLTQLDALLPLSEPKDAALLVKRLTALSDSGKETVNAKVRRRIKRMLERVGEVDLSLVDEAEEEVQLAVAGKAGAKKVDRVMTQVDAVEAAQLFEAATSVKDVERALNRLCNTVGETKLREDWVHLKGVLFALLEKRHLTNKNLRRRVQRLIFVLSDETEKEKLQQLKTDTTQAPPPPNPNPRPPRPAHGESSRAWQGQGREQYGASTQHAPAQAVEAGKPFDECLAQMQAARDPAGVEAALSNVSVFSAGDEAQRGALGVELQRVLADTALAANTKIRRKVSRLQALLLEKPSGPPVLTRASAAGMKRVAPAPAKAGTDIDGIARQLSLVSSGEALDALIEGIDVRELEGAKPAQAGAGRAGLKRALEDALSRAETAGNLNSKQRRRATRIAGAL